MTQPNNDFLKEMLANRLNAQPEFVSEIPPNLMTSAVAYKLLMRDPRLIKKFPASIRTSDLIIFSFYLGLSPQDVPLDALNLETTLNACMINHENFDLLPDDFKYPLNLAGACISNPDFLSEFTEADAGFVEMTKEFLVKIKNAFGIEDEIEVENDNENRERPWFGV